MNKTSSARRSAAMVVAALLIPALGACGSSSSSGGSSSSATGNSSGGGAGGSSSSAAPLFKELPAKIQQASTIQVGSSIDYPPFEYYAPDGKTLQGFETELAAELEKKLGVKFTWNNAAFDTLMPALTSQRYDIVYGAVNDTKEREKTFDMVYYLQSSQGFVVAKGNPDNIKTVDDLCGKSIAAVRGGVQASWLEDQSKTCTSKGSKAINVLTFDGNSQEQLAVRQGKASALLENYPTAVSFAQASNGALEVVPGLQVAKTYFAMVVPKSNSQLSGVLVKAWQSIIDDGSYGKILDKWKLSDIAVKTAGINGAK